MTDDEIEAEASECAQNILAHHEAMKDAAASSMLAELAALRAAGDALAREAGRMIGRLDPKTRFGLSVALTTWSTTRGGSGGDSGAGAAQRASQAPPDEPTIRAAVRAYILAEFLPGEDPAELKDDTPLVTGGILDERGVYRVHRFLADTFGVHLPADRFPWASFDSVAAIARMVVERLAARPATPAPREGSPP